MGRAGFEPATLCLKGTCSAVELTALAAIVSPAGPWPGRWAGLDSAFDMIYDIEEMPSPTPIDLLSRTEELLLLIVGELGDSAYGVPIRRRLARVLGRPLSVGAVYVPSSAWPRQGLLTTSAGAPTPVRGGRRKRFYSLTPKGLRALRLTRRVTESAWAAMAAAEPT